jgi:hypothetical protein
MGDQAIGQASRCASIAAKIGSTTMLIVAAVATLAGFRRRWCGSSRVRAAWPAATVADAFSERQIQRANLALDIGGRPALLEGGERSCEIRARRPDAAPEPSACIETWCA